MICARSPGWPADARHLARISEREWGIAPRPPGGYALAPPAQLLTRTRGPLDRYYLEPQRATSGR
eukprot:6195614-Pleurochrysis_carterae.AAC.1